VHWLLNPSNLGAQTKRFASQARLDSFPCITAVTSKSAIILNKSPKYCPNLNPRRYLYSVPPVGVSPTITRVLDGLYIGGVRDAEALSSDNPHQIATVITLCEEPVSRRSLTIRYPNQISPHCSRLHRTYRHDRGVAGDCILDCSCEQHLKVGREHLAIWRESGQRTV
jgi:hypothetical protein